jgi:predicted metal-dependent phosphoesterase TrpH
MNKKGLHLIDDFGGLGKADVHIHTNHSDAKPSVQEVLDYVENNTDLDVIAISDHDTMDGYFEARELMNDPSTTRMPKGGAGKNYRFEIIPAEEITSEQGHILGLFLKEQIKPGLSAKDTVKEIHRQGGLAVAAHPFEKTRWNNQDEPMMNGVGYRTLREIGHGFDAIEVINATPTLGDENYRATLINRLLIQSEMGDSDAHIVEAIGKGYSLFEGKTARDLKKAIVQHQTKAMSNKWTVLALAKYAYFFMPHALRILWNTILHGKTKMPEE